MQRVCMQLYAGLPIQRLAKSLATHCNHFDAMHAHPLPVHPLALGQASSRGEAEGRFHGCMLQRCCARMLSECSMDARDCSVMGDTDKTACRALVCCLPLALGCFSPISYHVTYHSALRVLRASSGTRTLLALRSWLRYYHASCKLFASCTPSAFLGTPTRACSPLPLALYFLQALLLGFSLPSTFCLATTSFKPSAAALACSLPLACSLRLAQYPPFYLA